MSIKRIIPTITMMLFMVFALSQVTESTFAYWASSITGDNDTATANVTMGDWQTIPAWDSQSTYLTGDQVQHNGTVYEAKKDNPTKEPGVSGGWKSEWLEIGPA